MKTRQYSRANRRQRCHQFTIKEDGSTGLTFWCPGCNTPHNICIEQGQDSSYPVWTFNGDFILPVFSPSVLSYWDKHKRDDAGNIISSERVTECHSFIGCQGAKPGEIIFLTDSPHWLSGKIVQLPLFTKTSAGFTKVRKAIQSIKDQV